MAFYNDTDEDELDQANGQQPGVQTSAQNGVISGGAAMPQGQQAAKTPAPDRPGNFVGISNYINANKPQAAKLGDQTAGIINQSSDKSRQSVGALNQAADQAIKPTQSLGEDIMSRIGTNAESLTADERNLAKQTASAQYTGPKAATDLSETYTQALKDQNTAENNINQSGTEQGRMGLISQVNSKPRTQGMNVFDNALLQAGSGREKLAQASNANKDVVGGLKTASDAIAGKIGRADDPTTPDIDESSGAIGQTTKAQQDTYKKIQDSLSAWKQGFTPKVTQAQQDLIDQQNMITQDLGDGQNNLSIENLLSLGLSPGQRIYDTDLKNYLNDVSPSDVTSANVASNEDYARYAALADLAGDQEHILRQEDVGKAGTAPKSKIDSQKLAKDLSEKEAAYQNAYETTKILPANEWQLPAAPPTAKELEQVWIPAFERGEVPGLSPRYLDRYKSYLEKWKTDQGYRNVVNPGKTTDKTPFKAHQKGGA